MRRTQLRLEDWAFRVSDRLRRFSIEAILTGGACVSLYSSNAYPSYDLDFVLRGHPEPGRIRKAMESLGFRLDSGRFIHPETEYFVEILPPPPSVGEDPIRETSVRRRGGLRLEMLTPTDCVKDRLAAFYHWQDRPSLAQAVLVARMRSVDMREIGRWSRAEGMAEPFKAFRRARRESRPAGAPKRALRRKS
jgi:hypothetical protein